MLYSLYFFIYTLNVVTAETTQNLSDVYLSAVILCSFLSAGNCFLYNSEHQYKVCSTTRQHKIESSPITVMLASKVHMPPWFFILFIYFTVLHRLLTNERFLSKQNHDSNLKCTSGSSVNKHLSQMFTLTKNWSRCKQIWVIPITVMMVYQPQKSCAPVFS